MADQQLNILLSTKAELAGAQQLEASLERDIGKAKALGNVDEVKRLTGELDTVRVAINKAQIATGEAVVESEKENISFREKREMIHGLTTAFPGLREAALFALHPMTLAAFGLGGAFELLEKKLDLADEALGHLEMPDLQEDITSAKNLAVAWEGIHKAVSDSLDKYSSAEGVFNRAKTAIQDELKATRDLLEAEKQKALADLEMGKSGMTPEAYEIRKRQIEAAFGDKNLQAEQEARQKEIVRKRDEFDSLQIAARNKSAAAAAIRLPEDDATFEAQQKALQSRVDAYRKLGEEHKKQAEDINQLQTDANGNLYDKAKAIPGVLKFGQTYGYSMTGDQAIDFHKQQAKDAEETADAIERTIAYRKRLKDKRDDDRKQASDLAGQAETIGLELPDDQRRANAQTENENRSSQIRNRAGNESAIAKIIEKNQGDQMSSLVEVERAAGYSSKQIAEVNQRIAKHLETIPQAFSVVLARLDKMQQQLDRATASTNLH